jgi:hypothetical protein
LLNYQEECAEWAKRVIDVASVTEDADSITEMHRAVFEKQPFAVDSPDGEHDLEDVVSSCIQCVDSIVYGRDVVIFCLVLHKIDYRCKI